jgi:hypothetical protein
MMIFKDAVCPLLLPLLEQLRMYCYNNRIEIPAFLAA